MSTSTQAATPFKSTVPGVAVLGAVTPEQATILTPEALQFTATLQRIFNPTRKALMQRRVYRQQELDRGVLPDFLPETAYIRNDPNWKAARPAPGLQDRRVEITGPVDRKMVINALNSGAKTFMADFEDSSAPTWDNMLSGQVNLRDANRENITFTNPNGKRYALRTDGKAAVLIVRPRGWHMLEKHVLVDGEPMSASIFDFALYFFHNAKETVKRGRGPYFYLPIAEADVYYPTTKVLWEPWRSDSSWRSDLLATTGDILRLWELIDHPRYGSTSNSINSSSRRNSPPYYMQQLVKKAELANTKQTDFCAPLTSFDWNEADPSLIVTSSIDTTCTVWNVETNQAKTQLIAHDSDVYDVAFMHGSADIFASVGADGSVRLFDLRSLEHSTILYEAPPNTAVDNGRSAASAHNGSSTSAAAMVNAGTNPLLRLQFNRMNPNMLATFHMDTTSVLVLDIRYPSTPTVQLVNGHQGSINGISWSPTQEGQLCTGGDDGQVLVWDIHNGTNNTSDHQTSPRHRHQYYQQQNRFNSNNNNHHHHVTRSIQDPILAYSAASEINSLAWSKGVPDWIGIGFGRTVQALRV